MNPGQLSNFTPSGLEALRKALAAAIAASKGAKR